MNKKNIKVNFILNVIRLTLGSLFVLITMPYVTKVLGSEKLGAVEYINSVVSYFLLFTALGIPNYGVREIAKVQNDKKELSQITLELISILGITTAIGYIVFFISCFYFKPINKELILSFIIGTNILFTNLGVEWFYIGIENQSYITKRFIIIRLLTLVMLFLFVKIEKDYLMYGAILVFMTSGSNLFNIYNLKNYISLKEIKKLNLKKHLKPILTIFVASLAVSIYLGLDSVMLGSIVGNKPVAYYSVANKLVRFELGLVTALGVVMVPRLSNALKNNQKENYIKYANISLRYILLIALPLMVGTFIFSKEIIFFMAGDKFEPAVITMQLISIILLIVGLAYFIGFQILYPNNMEKYYTYSVTIAAVINFIFNYLFIPKYAQNGAAIGTIIAELIGVICMLIFARKKLKEIEFYNVKNLKYVIAAIIMGIVIFYIKNLDIEIFYKLILGIIIGGISYFISLLVMKEEIIFMGLNFLKNKIKR